MTHIAGLETAGRSGERAPLFVLIGVCALLFAASAAGTIAWSASMPAMDGMAMSVWMPQMGQSWPAASATFLGMWVVMTVAMMLPALAPTLRPGLSAAVVGLGYFAVWTAFGAAAFPLGAALASARMQQPALDGVLPLAAGAVVLLAGCYQLTAVKARRLACCRAVPGLLPDGAGAALRHGLRRGLDCVRCCGTLMTVLLVTGVVDLRAMAVVAVAITAERLLPAGEHVARAIGVVTIAAGLFLIARAAGLA